MFDTSPSGVLTTMGTERLAVAALPAAISCVTDTKLVATAAPSNETTDPSENPAPFTANRKLPTGTGDGLTDVMLGSGRMVTDELPVAAGVPVLAARTVTVGGSGTVDGAQYWPFESMTPTTVSPPGIPF